MTMLAGEQGGLAATLAELKAYLRIEASDEDALLAGLLRAGQGYCEQFVGQWLIEREARETVAAERAWVRLAARPVVSIEHVEGIDAAGATVPLGAGDYAIDIDGRGEGWVRATGPIAAGRLRVTYRAGMAQDMNGLPDAIRHGIVRIAAEHHAARATGQPSVPAVAAALWRQWRRMRLA